MWSYVSQLLFAITYILYCIYAELLSLVMDHDNTASLHQIMVRLDYLYGSKVIEALLQKPGMSVLTQL